MDTKQLDHWPVVLTVKLLAVAPQCTSEALCSTWSDPDWSNRLFCCLKHTGTRNRSNIQLSNGNKNLGRYYFILFHFLWILYLYLFHLISFLMNIISIPFWLGRISSLIYSKQPAWTGHCSMIACVIFYPTPAFGWEWNGDDGPLGPEFDTPQRLWHADASNSGPDACLMDLLKVDPSYGKYLWENSEHHRLKSARCKGRCDRQEGKWIASVRLSGKQWHWQSSPAVHGLSLTHHASRYRGYLIES